MSAKHCHNCQTPFEPARSTARFCSAKCRLAYFRADETLKGQLSALSVSLDNHPCPGAPHTGLCGVRSAFEDIGVYPPLSKRGRKP